MMTDFRKAQDALLRAIGLVLAVVLLPIWLPLFLVVLGALSWAAAKAERAIDD